MKIHLANVIRVQDVQDDLATPVCGLYFIISYRCYLASNIHICIISYTQAGGQLVVGFVPSPALQYPLNVHQSIDGTKSG